MTLTCIKSHQNKLWAQLRVTAQEVRKNFRRKEMDWVKRNCESLAKIEKELEEFEQKEEEWYLKRGKISPVAAQKSWEEARSAFERI